MVSCSICSIRPITARRFNVKGHHGDNAPAAFAAGLHAGKERLYIVYAMWRGDANPRLMLRRSEDGGRTWSEAKEVVAGVADDLTHGVANVSVNRSGGIGISWLQRKINPAPQDYRGKVLLNFNETYDLFFTASLDGGHTFLVPMKITSRSSNPQSKDASRFWPGTDYMLTAGAGDGTFHLLWPDARTGIYQLYACAVRVE